jgi:hypothetical protein
VAVVAGLLKPLLGALLGAFLQDTHPAHRYIYFFLSVIYHICGDSIIRIYSGVFKYEIGNISRCN